MKRSILINRFGLIALLSLSLFTSTAFAGNSPGSTPVVVTNTAATPVPVVQRPQLYQASQTLNCTSAQHVDFTFNVPSGKTLIVRNVNVWAGSHGSSETFGVLILSDDGTTSYLALGFQPVGGAISSFATMWALNQQVQMSATQVVQGQVARDATNYAYACSTTITISGELI